MQKALFRFLILVLLLLSLDSSATQPPCPAEGDSLCHLHVQFRWDQIPLTACTNLQFAKDGSSSPIEDSLVVDVVDSTTAAIIRSGYQSRFAPPGRQVCF